MHGVAGENRYRMKNALHRCWHTTIHYDNRMYLFRTLLAFIILSSSVTGTKPQIFLENFLVPIITPNNIEIFMVD